MEKYIIGNNTNSYRLDKVKVNGKRINRIHINSKTFLQSGRSFKGVLVFLRISVGDNGLEKNRFEFLPMVKVLDRNLKENVYYYPNQVKKTTNHKNYSMPRAGESWDWGTMGQGRNPFRMQAGEMDGNVKTAPHVEEMMSGVGGYGFGIDEHPSFGYRGIGYGQYPNVSNYVYPNSRVTPSLPLYGNSYPQYSMIGGDKDGVTLNAGQSFDYGTMKNGTNPHRMEAGEQDGNTVTMPHSKTMTPSYSDASGRSKRKTRRYCTCLDNKNGGSYVQICPCNIGDTPVMSESYFSGGGSKPSANERGFGNWGLQAGDSFDYGTMKNGVNPTQMRAGEQDGNPKTMPQSYSYAEGDNDELTQEEMDALHQSSNKKDNFWTWLKSDKAKSLAKDSVGIATTLFNKKQKENLENQGTTEGASTYEPMDDDNKIADNKILNMHPLTFGIVAVGLIVGAVVVTSLIKKGKKA